mmetsp:Transcript_3504/g.7741  ORF Transcript_3504/g.7741 Transcript_3504/m.7741 type:complete len:723 (-) Transcript_3504:138-2306(-)
MHGMFAIQTMQCRHRCKVAACSRRLLQAGTNSRGRRPAVPSCVNDNVVVADGNDATARRCYSSYHAPATTFSSLNLSGGSQRGKFRPFSNFSTDEIVIQDSDPQTSATAVAVGATSTTAAAKTSLSLSVEKSQSEQSQCQKIHTKDMSMVEQLPPHGGKNENNNNLLPTSAELQGAHELFHQIYTESQALLRNNKNATTSDEVVAMADYFLILVNSLDFEGYIEMVQSLQNNAMREEQDGEEKEHHGNKIMFDGEDGDVEEKLHQAIKSMSQLHHLFLIMVENCIPLSPPITSKEMDEQSKKDGDIDSLSFDKLVYSAMTVGRALQLSRRAEELGMPMHRPLYQRLAKGVVLTSSLASSAAEPSSPPASSTAEHQISDAACSQTKESNSTEPDSLVLPGQFQQIKEGLHTNAPPLSLKLLDMFQSARSALKVSSGEQLQQLAEDLLAGPFLMLMKSKQWEEAMDLLHGWRALFGQQGGTIDLISLLGENHTLDALEIAKGWLDGTKFEEDVQTNPHVMELTGLLEVALSEILKGRKERADMISHLLWQSSLQNENDEEDGPDSHFEFEFEYAPDEEEKETDGEEELETPPSPTPGEFSTTTHFTPSDSPAVLGEGEIEPLEFSSTGSDDRYSMTVFSDDGANTAKLVNEEGENNESFTIIKGLSDTEARQSIYLRNGVDWVLPDVVPILEDWNKGNQLTFTPEFERYLGRQIMKEAEEDDED